MCMFSMCTIGVHISATLHFLDVLKNPVQQNFAGSIVHDLPSHENMYQQKVSVLKSLQNNL